MPAVLKGLAVIAVSIVLFPALVRLSADVTADTTRFIPLDALYGTVLVVCLGWLYRVSTAFNKHQGTYEANHTHAVDERKRLDIDITRLEDLFHAHEKDAAEKAAQLRQEIIDSRHDVRGEFGTKLNSAELNLTEKIEALEARLRDVEQHSRRRSEK